MERFKGENKIRWKEIQGFDGYFISDTGRVYSMKRKRILKRHPNTKGYLTVKPSLEGRCYNKRIHRLVAESFIPNPNNFPQINHINGNKLDNSVKNLEWCTQRQNSNHSIKYGMQYKSRSDLPPGVRYSENTNKYIVRAKIENKHIHFGCYDKKMFAIRVRNIVYDRINNKLSLDPLLDVLKNRDILNKNPSLYKGVSWCKGRKKYQAEKRLSNGKRKFLGYFDCDKEAYETILNYKEEV